MDFERCVTENIRTINRFLKTYSQDLSEVLITIFLRGLQDPYTLKFLNIFFKTGLKVGEKWRHKSENHRTGKLNFLEYFAKGNEIGLCF